jgi:hypothetical protein
MLTSHRLLPSVTACSIAITLAASWAAAAELIPPKVTERLYPQGVFCPLPFDLQFTSPGTMATLRFSTTTVNYIDTNVGGPAWSHQQLDDICISTEATFFAHRAAYSGDCYIGEPLDSLYLFQGAGALSLKELFNASIAGSGWDLNHGAYWDSSESGPDNPGTDGDRVGAGCLGLGVFDAGLALTDSAYTTLEVHGLAKGETYRLTGWWNVNQMQPPKIVLTVAILGPDAVPVARRSWGALKREYRLPAHPATGRP